MTSPEPSVLLDLAERCERATGPDRELDALIYAEKQGCDVRDLPNGIVVAKSRRPPFEEWRLGFIDPSPRARNFYVSDSGTIPHYTGSIDAAVMLVSNGFYWHLGHGKTRDDEPLGGASIIAPGSLETVAAAEAPTAALALCAAALRARSTDTGGK